jgi:hypothetical protein
LLTITRVVNVSVLDYIPYGMRSSNVMKGMVE